MARFGDGKTLDQLIDALANCEVGSIRHGEVMAEITYKQIHLQIASLESQRLAAEAETKAADAAIANTKYMFWSVIFAAASATITAVSVAFGIFAHQ